MVKLISEKQKNSSFPKKKSLVRLTPEVENKSAKQRYVDICPRGISYRNEEKGEQVRSMSWTDVTFVSVSQFGVYVKGTAGKTLRLTPTSEG